MLVARHSSASILAFRFMGWGTSGAPDSTPKKKKAGSRAAPASARTLHFQRVLKSSRMPQFAFCAKGGT
jgi:hypothetical protein